MSNSNCNGDHDSRSITAASIHEVLENVWYSLHYLFQSHNNSKTGPQNREIEG